MEQGDVIGSYRAQGERLWLLTRADGDTWTFGEADATRAIREGFEVDGPFVRAEQLEGAVDEIVAALRERYKSPEDPKANDYGIQGREAADFIERRFGGR